MDCDTEYTIASCIIFSFFPFESFRALVRRKKTPTIQPNIMTCDVTCQILRNAHRPLAMTQVHLIVQRSAERWASFHHRPLPGSLNCTSRRPSTAEFDLLPTPSAQHASCKEEEDRALPGGAIRARDNKTRQRSAGCSPIRAGGRRRECDSQHRQATITIIPPGCGI